MKVDILNIMQQEGAVPGEEGVYGLCLAGADAAASVDAAIAVAGGEGRGVLLVPFSPVAADDVAKKVERLPLSGFDGTVVAVADFSGICGEAQLMMLLLAIRDAFSLCEYPVFVPVPEVLGRGREAMACAACAIPPITRIHRGVCQGEVMPDTPAACAETFARALENRDPEIRYGDAVDHAAGLAATASGKASRVGFGMQ